MIASIVLPTLFIGSGLLSVGALASAWRGHWGQIRELRQQLAMADDTRELSIRLALTETREYLPVARRGGAVRARPAPAPVRPQPQHGRRAAA